MPHRILVIYGHPDTDAARYLSALAESYIAGAREAGHEVRRLDVGTLDLPPLRTAADYQKGKPPPAVASCQQSMAWADHWVVLFPLWLGGMPGMLKSFLEQTLRPDFAFAEPTGRGLPKKLLKGRSARIVVTMGMPGFFYKLVYRAHSLKSLERNILGFCGVAPIRASVIGMVEAMGDVRRKRWLARMRTLGARAL